MIKRYLSYLTITILFLAVCACNVNAQVKVDAHLDKATMPIGDQTVLHLIVHFPAKDTVGFPLIADSIAGKVQIVSVSKPDTSFDKSDISLETIERRYTITSFDTGQYIIPQYGIRTAGGILKTDELVLTIKSVAVDTTKGIYDIKQPFAVKYSFWEWLHDNWRLVAAGFVGVLAIIGIVWYLMTRPKKVVPVKEVKVVIPPDVEAIDKLNALREQKLWQRDQVKEYHSELTDVVRQYLEKRYAIKAHEQTSDEIFASLRYMDIDAESRNKLRQILILADLAKFAKQKPVAAENEQSMDNAIDFIIKTTRQAQVKPTIVEGKGDGLV